MDEGRDRIVEAQVNITNNMINMTADERTRRIEELQQKVLEHATPKPDRT